MQSRFSLTASRLTLAAAALLVAPLSAQSASFTVSSGATSTSQQTVSGADTGAIQTGGVLDVEDSAIVWDAPATGSGVSIVNQGVLRSGDRGVDTDGTVSGVFTLDNQGAITTADDSVRIDDAFANGDLRIVNAGSITSEGGQAFDFKGVTAATASLTVQNSGVITASDNDAMRLGSGTISIVNAGTIETTGDETRALSFDDDANVENLKSFSLVNETTGRIVGTDDAFKISADADENASNATIIIENHGLISAGAGQALDFADLTSADNVNTIVNTGTIRSAEGDVMRLGSGTISIVNSGTIETTGDETRALSLDDDANIENLKSLTLVNDTTGRIVGTDDAFKISADADENASNATITIENHGLIAGDAGQAIDFADLTSAGNVITIINSGTIQSAAADAVRPGAGASVVNSGLIQSTDLTSDGDAVDFQDFGGSVENQTGGQILGAKHGVTGAGAVTVTNAAGGLIAGRNGSGVNIDSIGDSVVTVTNYGTIRGEVTGNIDDDGDPDGVPDGDGDGVDVDGKLDLRNYGLIQGTGATGTNDGEPNTADAIAAGGGVIRNYQGGVIEAFDSFGGGVGRGILVDDSAQGPAPFATTVINQGTIRSDGAAITFIGSNADTIENDGVISSDADVAVDMGGGDDLFVYGAGSQVTGAVTGADGSDTLALKGAGGSFDLDRLGDAAGFRSFETLSVLEGASFAATGSSDFAGAVQIGGALTLNGALGQAAATVLDGGFLGGGGSVGSLAVASGGVVSPGGGSIGTLTVANAATFDQGSVYRVDVSSAGADQIVASSAAINGGTVVVTALGGPVSAGSRYDIVSAGQVTGAFDGVSTSSFVFIDPTLAYTGTAVSLQLTRNDTSFESVASSANQRAVARALDAGGAAASYVAGAGSAAEARQNFDLLSGEGHASVGATLFQQNALVADTLLSRLRQTSAGVASLSSDAPVLYYASGMISKSDAFDAVKAPAIAPVFATWAEGFGQWSKADGRNGSASVDGSLGGILAGADVTTDGFTFGLAGGYASANSDVDARRSHQDADTILIAAYVGAAFDAFKLRGGASYGWSDIDSRRTAVAGGISERPTASYDGSTANAFAEAAYTFGWASGQIEPFAQLAWSNVETDRFTERNAPVTGLSGDGLSFDTIYTTLGARITTTFAMSGAMVTPHATLAWRHATDDVKPEIGMQFRNGGGDFTVAGAPIARNSLLVGAGVDVGIGANLTLGVAYEGQLADDASYNAVKGRVSYRF